MVAVIGAGASGMVASILLARKGVKVLLIERQDRGGKKILASGNGKCNITNSKIAKSNFYANSSALIDSLLKEYTIKDIESFFNSLGLSFYYSKDGRVFPYSMQASSVLNLLEAEIQRLNIRTIYSATNLEIDKNFNIKVDNKEYKAKCVVLATGSVAASQLGGNSSGLEIAKTFKHSIIEPMPALVPLLSNAAICKLAQGVKLSVKLTLLVNKQETTTKEGDLLFTKYGISGLSVLDISRDVAIALKSKKDVVIAIDFFTQYNKKEFLNFLKSRVDKSRDLPINLWLGAILNSKISKQIVKELNLEKKSEADLNSTLLKELTQSLKSYKIKIDNLRDFKYAEVAIGGVDSRELTTNLESKKQKNLYFTGEILDVVGDRGGYNFTFAFFSAFRVAKAINTSLKDHT